MSCTTSCGWGFTTRLTRTSTTCRRRGGGTCGTCCCCGCRSELVRGVCSCGVECVIHVSPATQPPGAFNWQPNDRRDTPPLHWTGPRTVYCDQMIVVGAAAAGPAGDWPYVKRQVRRVRPSAVRRGSEGYGPETNGQR